MEGWPRTKHAAGRHGPWAVREKLAKLKALGKLNARERFAYFLDNGVIVETGLLSQSAPSSYIVPPPFCDTVGLTQN